MVVNETMPAGQQDMVWDWGSQVNKFEQLGVSKSEGLWTSPVVMWPITGYPLREQTEW